MVEILYEFFQVTQGLPNMGTTIQTMQGHILTQQGGNTYLIQGGTMDGEGTPLTHTTRASPATVFVCFYLEALDLFHCKSSFFNTFCLHFCLFHNSNSFHCALWRSLETSGNVLK